MERGNRPSIFKIGHADDIGNGNGARLLYGWGLEQCASGCVCHRHPVTGNLVLHEDNRSGYLGLISFAPGGCDCCQPWSSVELAAIVQHLTDIEALTDSGVFDQPAEGQA